MKKLSFFAILILISGYFFWGFKDVFSFDYSTRGIISDHAVFGLMAHDLLKGDSFPWYYYGQNYMGPFTSLFIAFIQIILNILGLKQQIPFYQEDYLISPMALQLSGILMAYLGHLFLSLGFSYRFGRIRAAVLFFVLATSPYILTRVCLRPLGGEMAYFFAGIIYFIYEKYKVQNKSINQSALLGGLFSLSMWGNQTIVFLWAAILLSWAIDADLPRVLVNFVKTPGRVSLKYYSLGTVGRVFAHFLQLISAFLLAFGLIVSWFYGEFIWHKFKVPNGFSSIKIALIALMLLHGFLDFRKDRTVFLKVKQFVIGWKRFIVGYLICSLPLFLAGLFKFYDKAYSFKFKLIKLADYPIYLQRLILDYFPKTLWGINDYWVWFLILALLVVLLLELKKVYLKDLKILNQKRAFVPVMVVVFNFLFIVLSERAREQYVFRYALLIVPFFLMLLISLFQKENKLSAVLLSLLLGVNIYLSILIRTDIIKAVGESSTNLNEEIQSFFNSGYSSCFADYGSAYRLEFITGRKVLFIPYESQDRTPKRSALLAPVTNCLYKDHKIALKP